MASALAISELDPSWVQQELSSLNQSRLRPSLPLRDARGEAVRDQLASELKARLIEADFVESCRREIADWADEAPRDPERFIRWFDELRERGPGQHDPLFNWLAEEASLAELRWFLAQEVAGEAGFEDLVALTQLKMPTQAKLELARNYWDEMGRGAEVGMHGPMLSRLAEELELDLATEPVTEALALANLLVALAANRPYAFHSVGALGAIELTAPDRSRLVNQSLRRLRVPARSRRYFALHSTLDLQHSRAWNREVILPLLEAHPDCATAIAEGALMRLAAGKRCFDRYRRELRLEMFLGRKEGL